MSKTSKKYYVVWHGANPGIYGSWNECQAQIKGFPGAQYKSYKTRPAAEQAYMHGPEIKASKKKANTIIRPNHSDIIWESISVDAACSGNPGVMEYQGVDTKTKSQIFHKKFQLGTNNIGEFLALVHALALYKKLNNNIPIYTDSEIARKWVIRGNCKTTLVQNNNTAELHRVIQRAEKWLKDNTFSNQLLKWNTRAWGEIPADFGRK